jgi:hypothetical protein
MAETLKVTLVQQPYSADIAEARISVVFGQVIRLEGDPGDDGADGDNGGIRYDFDTTTTDADPGDGLIRFNHATIGSVTFLYIDNEDVYGTDVSAWLDSFDDSTNTIKGTLTIATNFAADSTLAIFNVTGTVVNGTGYRKVPVAYVSGTKPDLGEPVCLTFSRAGNVGASADGEKGGVRYNFSTTTTDSDPGTGTFRYNNGTFASITEVYVDNVDVNSVDMTTWLDSFDNSTSTIRGILVIKSNGTGDATIGIFNVTGSIVDGTGYRKIIVTALTGSVPSAAEECVIEFIPKGDKGDTGATGTHDPTKVIYEDDFLRQNSLGGGNVEWLVANSGTGSGGTTIGWPSENDHIGIAMVATGTTSSGFTAIFSPELGADLDISDGDMVFEVILKVPTISDGTDDYTINTGLDTSTNGVANNSVVMRYNHALNSGKWILVYNRAGVTTTIDSGITVASDTWYRLKFTITNAAHDLEFFVDGSSVGTATPAAPIASAIQNGIKVAIVKNAGTTDRRVHIDYIYVEQTLDR